MFTCICPLSISTSLLTSTLWSYFSNFFYIVYHLTCLNYFSFLPFNKLILIVWLNILQYTPVLAVTGYHKIWVLTAASPLSCCLALNKSHPSHWKWLTLFSFIDERLYKTTERYSGILQTKFGQEGTRNKSTTLTLDPLTQVYSAAGMLTRERLRNKHKTYCYRLKTPYFWKRSNSHLKGQWENWQTLLKQRW